MQLNEILKEMNEQGKCSGDTAFDVLALIDAKVTKPVLTFIDNRDYIPQDFMDCTVLVEHNFADAVSARGLCACENPRLLFFKIHNYLSSKDGYKRELSKTTIGNNCKISPLSFIADNNVSIGDNTVIEEFVSIKENTTIGSNCIIRSGCTIGGEGFEYKRDGDEIYPVIHSGGVTIGNNVEIQHQCTVDKAVFPWDDTVIGEFCKIDNLVHIAHSVKLGKRVLMAANALISGRTTIGDDVWIGATATISNAISIGNNARVNIGAVATKNVDDNQSVTGNFAIDHMKFIRNLKEQSRG